MLTNDRNVGWYFIYPPGVEFSYRWAQLHALLSDPIRVLSEDPNFRRFDRARHGISDTVKPCQLIDGPCGGGIIYVDLEPNEKWLPVLLLSKEADLMGPQAMIDHEDRFGFHVNVLQPRDEALMPRIKGSEQFSMLEAATAEHSKSVGGKVYWLVTLTKATAIESVRRRVVDVAHSFNCTIEPVSEMPGDLRNEVAPLFARGGRFAVAFRVPQHPQSIGLNFAIMLYTGLMLRRAHSASVRTMHLLAEIEGEPTVWC